MFFNKIRRVLALAIFLAIGSNANAALTGTYCDSGVGDLNPAVNNETPAQNVSDVAFGAQFANNCHGRQTGNDDVSIVNEIWGGTWSFLAKDEGLANEGLGLEWLLTSSGSSNTYQWSLSATDQNGTAPANLGDIFDFVFVVKSGNGFASYRFDEVSFAGSENGTFVVSFLNNGNQVGAPSHVAMYGRYVGEGDGPPNEVSEPGTLAAASLGLFGLALLRRRQRH